MHYYQFDIKAYAHATVHLTNEEDLCYRRLLDIAYDTERPITLEGLARKVRMSEETVLVVLREFFIHTDNGYIHPVVDKELAKTYERSEKARQSARSKRSHSERTPIADRSHSERLLLTTQDSPLNTQEKTVAVKPQPTQKLTDAEWFDSIKGHYPHLDIEAESRKMDAWLSTRPGKQKTRRFVVNWLNRIDAPMPATVSTLPSEYAF
jgi:hypothetical protein